MSNKRQRRSSPSTTTTALKKENEFYVEALEANLIYQSEDLAAQVDGKVGEGGRLQRYSGVVSNGEEVWIDRYDILNLLDSVPIISTPSPTHSAGFEDIPEEELFYFNLEERENVSRIRKKRMMEEGRLARIRAREEDDRLEAEAKRLDHEPSEEQLALMKKLHLTLSASPDPSLLEMRILANHGVDPRFSFLRKGGKFREVWDQLRKEVNVVVVDPNLPSGSGLVAYGSDSEDEVVEEEEEKVIFAEGEVEVTLELPEETVEEQSKKELKAEKVREWARKRKAARGDI